MKKIRLWKPIVLVLAMVIFVIIATPNTYAVGNDGESEAEITEEETTEVKIATDSNVGETEEEETVDDEVATDSNAEETTETLEEDFLENDLLEDQKYLSDLMEEVDGVFVIDSSTSHIDGDLLIEDGAELELEKGVTLKADHMLVEGDMILSLGKGSKVSVEIEGTKGATMKLLLADGATTLKASQFLNTSFYKEDGESMSFSTISSRGMYFEWDGSSWVWIMN